MRSLQRIIKRNCIAHNKTPEHYKTSGRKIKQEQLMYTKKSMKHEVITYRQ